MLNLRSAILTLPILLSLSLPLPAHADTKVLTAEGTYTMGEGETMTFAESMAIQKAKQTALEQAGTYVESYTKVQNYQLTAEEIQTIAGGVLQVEVLDKTRTLVGDGLKFFVKIKATVTTDRVAELAQRIKGKNVAEEYKKLQGEYARLSKEIETLKEIVAKTPTGPKRAEALDKIKEGEKAFAVIQKREGIFLERLVSGEMLFSKAQAIVDEKRICQQKVDNLGSQLASQLLDQGHAITIGEPDVTPLQDSENAKFAVLITVRPKASKTIENALAEAWNSSCGKRDLRKLHDIQNAIDASVGKLAVALEVAMRDGDSYNCWHRLEEFDWVDTDDANRLILSSDSVSFKVTTKFPIKKLKEIRAVRGKLVSGETGPTCSVEQP